MNCKVSVRRNYCPCMPAKGDGTYDGAGGSAVQAAATHAMASRINRRLIVFMLGIPSIETSKTHDRLRGCPRHFISECSRFHMQPL
jgi:hypothetical protein